MPSHNVAPTKSNLLREKERLALALEGYDLLERKREILVMELMKRVDEVRILEREIGARCSTAYPAMRRMLLSVGRERAKTLSAGMKCDFPAREKRVQVAGLAVASLEAEAPPRVLPYSFVNSFADSDQTMLEFAGLLKLVAEMAGLRGIVWRLAKELKKTQRRVNALEKMVIPESRGRARYIEAALEERDRESVFAGKLLKARRAEEGEP
ncbi:MAG: V-type ATP synthase subunit D [Spirochaetaceae bacterium]|nr:V-type ATP synthase subunit D [Spirochaetaceae bacterium]